MNVSPAFQAFAQEAPQHQQAWSEAVQALGAASALAANPAALAYLAAMAAAVAHNIGQIAVAVAVTGTPEIAFYLPVLLVAGVAAGFATGTVAQAVLDRIPHAHATADRGKRVRA